MGGVCSAHGEFRNPYRILVGKLEGERQFGRPRRRWEDNIKTHLEELASEDVNLIHLAINPQVPLQVTNSFTS
jgi:hypothetical protein